MVGPTSVAGSTRPRRDGRRGTPSSLVVAAGCGLVHAAFSAYWALGGRWLVDTLGARLLATFAGRELLLLPVALVKAGFAVLPLLLARLGRPWQRPTRALCWFGAAVLVLWGGANTVVGNLVLTGVLHPDGGVDHAGMVGHAWLWDPLFLAWGLALVAGLLLTRAQWSWSSRPESTS